MIKPLISGRAMTRWFLYPMGCAVLAAAGLAWSPVHGAVAEKESDIKASRAAKLQKIQSMQDAMALAAGQDVDNCEAVLKETLDAKAGTASWHLQMAQRMVQLARELVRKGRDVRSLISRANSHLGKALQLAPASDSSLIASIKKMEGLLRENFLNDAAGARRAYAEALTLSSGSTSAREAVTRLNEADKTTEKHKSLTR